ncbi:MAG: repeat protein [Bacteroidetes bacterium]|nr:repeat protein [Bacteroidota bacterium]
MRKLIVVLSLLIPSLFFAQEKPELVITTGHIKGIRDIDYHPSGKQIATCSEDNTIKIWDIALRQEFRTLLGHTSEVTQVKYTPDGKYIVSKERNGPVFFWDSQTGAKLSGYMGDAMAMPFSFSADGKKVMIQTDDSLCVLEIPNAKIVASTKFSSASSWARLHSNGKQFISEDGGNLAIFDFGTEDPVQQIAPSKGRLGSGNIQYCPGAELASGYNFKEVVLFDLKAGKPTITIPCSLADRFQLAEFSADGKKMIVATNGCKVTLYDTQTGKDLLTINEFIAMPKPGQITFTTCGGLQSVAFSPDGKNVAINGQLGEMKDGKFKSKYVTIIYDLSNGKRICMLEGSFKMIRTLALVNSDKYLATDVLGSSNAGIRFWNLKDGSIIKHIPGYYASFSKSGDKAAIWYPDTMTVFTTNTFEILHKIRIPALTACYVSADAKYVVAARVNTLNVMNKGIQVYDATTGKQVAKYEVPHATFALNFKISPDNKYIIGNDRMKLDVRDLMTGRQIPQTDNEYDVNKILEFVPGTNQVIVTDTKIENHVDNFRIHVIDYVTGKHVETFDGGIRNFIFSGSFSPDGKTFAAGSGTGFGDDYKVTLFDWATKKVKCQLTGHHYDVNHITWSSDGNTIYTASDDGTAKSWDAATCMEKGTFICMNGPEEYIIHSPDYYYKCSKGNYDGICFRYKGKLYRFDQFDLVLNRPDIVMERLGSPKLLVGMYKQAWKKRVKRLGFTEEMMSGTLSLPDAEVIGKESIAHTGGKIKFKVNAKDESSVINRVNVFVNNVPLYGVKGMDVSGAKSKTLSKEISLELSNGANQIDVSVINDKGLESAKESFQIDFAKPVTKPDLYIFALGVSRFKDSKHDLKFPVKDSKDFIGMMKSGTQFGKTEVVFIQDSVATKEKIVEASKVLEKAKIDDQVIVYISSHGLLDDKLDYFIATHDVNFEQPAERGLPYDEIENMLNKVAARNRLVLIDACHSGEVDKEGVEVVSSNGNADASKVTTKSGGSFAIKPKAGLKNSFSYMQALFSDVSKGSGATVISAAGGNEFALESKDWNNGVFTYSILKGLKSNEADLDKDKTVKISELKFYVIDKVAELTGGKQTPTARKENEVNNFIIYKK